MTTSAPIPWTLPQPLPGVLDLGPGFEPEALRRGLEALAARNDVKALVVFGSRARGCAQPDSDLNLLVYGQQETAWLSGSRWHVLGRAARGGRVLYVAQ